MSRRCSHRTNGRRCHRNGFGNPPLCRAHALEEIIGDDDDDFPDLLQVGLDALDRHVARSTDSVVRSLRNRLGDFLSGAAAARARPRVTLGADPAVEYPPPPPRAAPPPPPPPPEPKKKDPRTVLGFPPGSVLTRKQIKDRQRRLCELFHPDKGGSTEATQDVNAAARELLAELS